MHLWPPATTHRSTPMLLAAAVLPVAYAASVPPFLRRPRRRGPRKGCGLIRDHQKRSWLAHLICSAGRKLSLRRVVCASTRQCPSRIILARDQHIILSENPKQTKAQALLVCLAVIANREEVNGKSQCQPASPTCPALT